MTSRQFKAKATGILKAAGFTAIEVLDGDTVGARGTIDGVDFEFAAKPGSDELHQLARDRTLQACAEIFRRRSSR